MRDLQSETNPAAWLDSPLNGELLSGSVHVRGWAAVRSRSFTAEAWLGDRRLGFVERVDRPDVAARYGPGFPERCGFDQVFPIAIHQGGPRRLRVVVTSSDGTVCELESAVEVAGAAPAGGARIGTAAGYRLLRGDPVDGAEWPWFREHHDQAPREIVEFLQGAEVSLEGRSVADVGCGDGIIDLGLMHHARPRRLTAFDLEPVSTDGLLAEARANDLALEALPAGLQFSVCSATQLPAPDASFDAVVSWSAFEHVSHPIEMMREIRRVLRSDGFLFLQIWPLWWSRHGSHLWPWYPAGFAPLVNTDEQVLAGVQSDPRGSPEDMRFIAEEYQQLNRIKVDELQRVLLAAGLVVAKFELLTSTVHVPVELSRFPLTDLGVDGIKLVAVPA